jgi:hypothetical protein
MRKFIAAVFAVAFTASAALAQSEQAPTLRIVSEDGNRLPSELVYGNTKVKPLRLRPGTNTPITIDDSDFFVQQQYVDFLSRFPDQSGFAFWQGEINQCGANLQCVEVMRVNVSAAFFLSIELQATGLHVYKTHKAAFGDISPERPVPVRRESFMPEARGIANGIIVGDEGWQAKMENNKNAYSLDFVQRGDFRSAYPDSMTAAQFVDKLDANAGGVLTSAERDGMIALLGATPSDAAKRAQVLRGVAENNALHAKEVNKAFVLMQYFGYLKRNPDDLPDADFSGYRFWLKKLDEAGGDFHKAEMVKAFISSAEYRTRF